MGIGYDDEGPGELDADLFEDGGDVIDCPHCGGEIYAYAEKCPLCGTWLTMRHRQVKGMGRRVMPKWLIVAGVAGVVVCIAIMAMLLLGGLL